MDRKCVEILELPELPNDSDAYKSFLDGLVGEEMQITGTLEEWKQPTYGIYLKGKILFGKWFIGKIKVVEEDEK